MPSKRFPSSMASAGCVPASGLSREGRAFPSVLLCLEWGQGSFSLLCSLSPCPGSRTALVDLCDLDCTYCVGPLTGIEAGDTPTGSSASKGR